MGFWIFMLIVEWLTPITMIIFGGVFVKSPPKDVNGWYGYRTKRSMKNQQTWDFAHAYCGKLWYKLGICTIIPTTIAGLLSIGKSEDTIGIISIIIIFIQLIVMVATLPITENALKKNFDEDGNKM